MNFPHKWSNYDKQILKIKKKKIENGWIVIRIIKKMENSIFCELYNN